MHDPGPGENQVLDLVGILPDLCSRFTNCKQQRCRTVIRRPGRLTLFSSSGCVKRRSSDLCLPAATLNMLVHHVSWNSAPQRRQTADLHQLFKVLENSRWTTSEIDEDEEKEEPTGEPPESLLSRLDLEHVDTNTNKACDDSGSVLVP